jgi:hypothetical protein
LLIAIAVAVAVAVVHLVQTSIKQLVGFIGALLAPSAVTAAVLTRVLRSPYTTQSLF